MSYPKKKAKYKCLIRNYMTQFSLWLKGDIFKEPNLGNDI